MESHTLWHTIDGIQNLGNTCDVLSELAPMAVPAQSALVSGYYVGMTGKYLTLETYLQLQNDYTLTILWASPGQTLKQD